MLSMSKIDKIDPRYSGSITFISCILDIIYVILYYEDYLPIDTTTFGCVYELLLFNFIVCIDGH